MKSLKYLSLILFCLSIMLVTTGIKLNSFDEKEIVPVFNFKGENVNISSSNSLLNINDINRIETSNIKFVEMARTPASIYIPPRIEVYDGYSLDELGRKLNKYLGNDYVKGKGPLIAKLCIEKGVDPYIAVSIILHETGCGTKCSKLARYCNNVGGQKGSPSCNGGSFKRFDTLDEGIDGFISNLSRNYFKQGRTTVETIAPKYCEGNTWAGKINYFVNKMKKDRKKYQV